MLLLLVDDLMLLLVEDLLLPTSLQRDELAPRALHVHYLLGLVQMLRGVPLLDGDADGDTWLGWWVPVPLVPSLRRWGHRSWWVALLLGVRAVWVCTVLRLHDFFTIETFLFPSRYSYPVPRGK